MKNTGKATLRLKGKVLTFVDNKKDQNFFDIETNYSIRAKERRLVKGQY